MLPYPRANVNLIIDVRVDPMSRHRQLSLEPGPTILDHFLVERAE